LKKPVTASTTFREELLSPAPTSSELSEFPTVYDRKDTFYKKAKQAGYRSRSAYKLIELNNEFHFLKPGGHIVDLGSWPGGWVQVGAAVVGKTGHIVGIDLVALAPLPLTNVTLLQGDATDQTQQEKIRIVLNGPADVVLSDMAPKLSGIRERDDARAMDLCHAALSCARSLLRPGGALLVKVFMGDTYQTFLTELRTAFATVRVARPNATRKGSAETYVLATDLRKS
jgi:23S rRNA (uridine2552-2'-O)-methyltransferase